MPSKNFWYIYADFKKQKNSSKNLHFQISAQRLSSQKLNKIWAGRFCCSYLILKILTNHFVDNAANMTIVWTTKIHFHWLLGRNHSNPNWGFNQINNWACYNDSQLSVLQYHEPQLVWTCWQIYFNFPFINLLLNWE